MHAARLDDERPGRQRFVRGAGGTADLDATGYDGREIALTPHSVALLDAQDACGSRIAAGHRAPLHETLVFDGTDAVPSITIKP